MIGLGRPLYVALGHSTGLALIDKYADQSFHAPSGFGAAIARATWSVARLRNQERELEELATRVEAMENNLKRSA